MKKIGLIPCRLESTRLPNKPIELIQNIPMFAHVYYRSEYTNLDEVYVCTDSDEIMKISEDLGLNSILTKSEHTNGTERCAEASSLLGLSDNDIVVDIQGDEPLLNPEDVNKLISFFNPEIHDIVLGYLTVEEKNNVNAVKLVTDDENQVLFFSRLDIPLNFRNEISLKKQVGLVAFTNYSIQKFSNSQPTSLELVEGVELLRAIELDLKMFGVELDFETRSVDTKDDLDYVRKNIQSDELFKKYNNREVN
tara:strand:+ start:688 stop:1440 length:753 start_codon:yes stop_codon:yes gene_type:complete